ncbi:hypothetical protein [Methanobacterium petrolearium]|uniref:hypothetical protein n=1 Tax=Methanobacterium petrolearium TaxID=710190 RepID=UPI001AE5F6C2|nr:hypothetical protein [Methanobacterium petrolearium]MBP1944720.1 hypothetical protein [Methanobacterium petrolearium]
MGNTNHTPLTFTVDNTPPVINPEIIPEAGKPGETINITVHASPDTQGVVAIIGTQRTNLTFTNGIWTTTYIIPLDSTFDIHTIRIEGTDMVGNVGKNIASYEVLDPNPIPPWLEDLINPDTPNPGNTPTITTNTGPGNNGGSNNPGSGTIGGNNQLYRDQMYIRNTLTYTPTTDPNTNTTTPPPEMPGWEIDTSLIGEILLATFMIATSAAATILGQRESKGGFFGKFGELYGYQKTKSGKIEVNWLSAVLTVASWFGFTINPNVFDAIILLIGALGFFFNFIAQMMNSTLMTLYSIAILSLILISYAAKIANYPGDKMELIKNDLKDITTRLKNIFSID